MALKMGKKPSVKTPAVVKPAVGQQDFAVEQAKAEDLKSQKIQLAGYLEQSCMEVKLKVKWFTTSRRIAKNVMAAMVAAYEKENAATSEEAKESEGTTAMRSENIGGTQFMMSSKHPIVKAANEAKRAIESYRNSKTAPVPEVPPQGVELTDEVIEKLSKEAGTRMIPTSQIDEFHVTILKLSKDLDAAVQAVNDNMQDIIAFDQARTPKKLFNAENYPDKVAAGVHGPFYQEVGYTANFEKMAPVACNAMRSVLQARLLGGVDMTIAELSSGLMDYAKIMSSQLGTRTRLLVPREHPLYDMLRDAEVMQLVDSKQDTEVPKGQLGAQLKLKAAKGQKADIKWFFFTKEEYDALRPYSTDEKRIYRQNSLGNVRHQVEAIRNLAEILGPFGASLVAAADKIDDALASLGNGDAEVNNELRNSGFAAKQIVSVFNEAVSMIEGDSKIKAIIERSRKRSIIRSNKSDEDED